MTSTFRAAFAVGALAAAVTLLAGCADGPPARAADGGPLIGGPLATSAAPSSEPAAPTTAPTTTPAMTPPATSTTPVPGAEPPPPPTDDPPPPGPVNPPRCGAAALTASLGESNAGAGSVYRTLVLGNAGAETCELTGWPTVFVVGADGRQFGQAAQTVGEPGGPVRLDAGGAAVADLRMVNVGNYDPEACRPTPVSGLDVYPPGDTQPLFVPLETTGCAGNPPSNPMEVGAFGAR